MGWSTSKVFTVARIVAVAAVVSGLIAGAAARPMAQAGPDSHAKNVEGVWLVQVTQRNCETNAALGSFTSLVTFDGDGIVIESPGSVAFAPGQRSPGHGTWTRDGQHTVIQRMVALILFDTPPNPPVSPGFRKGWQMITHTVDITGPDTLTSAGTARLFDSNGELYRSGCSTAVGERFD